jgi:hypothetical protein
MPGRIDAVEVEDHVEHYLAADLEPRFPGVLRTFLGARIRRDYARWSLRDCQGGRGG